MSVIVYGLSETARIGFMKAALRTALLLIASYAALRLVVRATFGAWIDWQVTSPNTRCTFRDRCRSIR